MKLKQRKERNQGDATPKRDAKTPAKSKAPSKSTGVISFITEKAAKHRGVADWGARKQGSRAL
jgi:hypothetical protein